MTLGEKIAKERKENNFTQEQLADLLGVSRQTVSKWESDIAYPETDKLIRMGRLFDCSMDYLLKDECTEKSGTGPEEVESVLDKIHLTLKSQPRERKSQKTVFGMPLYHIARDARGFFAIGLKAKGVFAIGLAARGIFSLGLLSVGVISVGLLAVGLLSVGTFALGLISLGSIALGLFSCGAVSIGAVSFGALSVGGFSGGALAIGKYMAVGDNARAMIAVGDSEATGKVYSYIGELSSADISFIRGWLDENVPSYLSWANRLFQMIMF
ncbi:MAG: helix-turn-helix domain-containing protein [Eubacteriales bacterium]